MTTEDLTVFVGEAKLEGKFEKGEGANVYATFTPEGRDPIELFFTIYRRGEGDPPRVVLGCYEDENAAPTILFEGEVRT